MKLEIIDVFTGQPINIEAVDGSFTQKDANAIAEAVKVNSHLSIEESEKNVQAVRESIRAKNS